MDPVPLNSAPAEGQKVEHEGKIFTTIREGLAYILVPTDAQLTLDPKNVKNGLIESQSVFYNPIQQFNRDLSVLAIKAFGEDLVAVKQAKAEAKKPRPKKGLREKRGVKRKADGEELVETDAQNATQAIEIDMVASGGGNPTSFFTDGVDITSNNDDATTVQNSTSVEPVAHGGNAGIAEQKDVTSEDVEDAAPSASHITTPGSPMQSNKSAFQTKFRILDALSATGLRALRYAQEIPSATHITANDLSAQAVASIKVNVEHNKLETKVRAITGNALTHMYSFMSDPTEGPVKESRYDVIDLDPYGTAAPFLDAAVQALNDGGLLCITCTDAGVFASCGYPEKTYSLYGGTPIKGLHSHEGGLRLILHAIATSAARYGMSIEPLLSLSIDFYARVFVRVYRSPAEVKMLAGKTMLVYSCDSGCGAWQTQFIARNTKMMGKDGKTSYMKHGLAQATTTGAYCEHCGFKRHLNGPMYGGPLHNPAFIQTILNYLPDLDKKVYATTSRIEGMLSTALEETLLDDEVEEGFSEKDGDAKPTAQVPRPIPRADASKIDAYPFFFFPSALSKVLHTPAPGEALIKGALRRAGYRATRSHCKPGTIKTDAPWSFIWEMMREWVRQKAPVKKGLIKEGTPGWKIMGEEIRDGGEDVTTQDGASLKTPTVDGNNRNNGQGEDIVGNGGAARPESIVFDETLGREASRKRLVRYQANPRANWGPMNRAKSKGKSHVGGGHNNDGE